jgi:hypothetical protein
MGIAGERLPRLDSGQPRWGGLGLTLFLETPRGEVPDSEVMGTLDATRRLVEAVPSPTCARSGGPVLDSA